MPGTASHKLAYRIPEVAELFGLSRAHIYNMVARGEIRAIRFGNAVRIPVTEVDRLTAGDAA